MPPRAASAAPSKAPRKPKLTDKAQSERFIEAAQKAGLVATKDNLLEGLNIFTPSKDQKSRGAS